VLGIGKGKKKAKHSAKQDAAFKMMVQIRKSYRAGGTLNNVSRETMLSYCEWYAQIVSILFWYL
jgi:RISC-loading complex subunit TARBP2